MDEVEEETDLIELNEDDMNTIEVDSSNVPVEILITEGAEGTIVYHVYPELKRRNQTTPSNNEVESSVSEIVNNNNKIGATNDNLEETIDEEYPPSCFIINSTNEIPDQNDLSLAKVQRIEECAINRETFVCELCDKTFDIFNDLKCHNRLEHSLQQFESVEKSGCPICQCHYKPKKAITMVRPFLCGICDKSFKTVAQLKKHFDVHVKPETYYCDICSTNFDNDTDLNSHIKEIHKSKKTHYCPICNKLFRTVSNVKSHMRVHSSDRPHTCEFCDKAFKSNSELRSHKLIHSGEKPYACEFCGKRFRQSGNFHSHLRIHKNERPYVCEICNRAFIESSKLKRHLRIHTLEKPYSCEICGKRFCDTSNKNSHMKTHSKENKVVYVMLLEDEQQENELEDIVCEEKEVPIEAAVTEEIAEILPHNVLEEMTTDLTCANEESI